MKCCEEGHPLKFHLQKVFLTSNSLQRRPVYFTLAIGFVLSLYTYQYLVL